jgi:hypothetical protein
VSETIAFSSLAVNCTLILGIAGLPILMLSQVGQADTFGGDGKEDARLSFVDLGAWFRRLIVHLEDRRWHSEVYHLFEDRN